MFGPLGFPEMLFILVLALLIFGPKRLPEVGRTIGKGMAQFRKATSDLKRTIETEIALDAETPRFSGRASGPAAEPRHPQAQLPGASLPRALPGTSPDATSAADPAPAPEPEPGAAEAEAVAPKAPAGFGESQPS
ncbi:MAG: twin-arginine translocase TatA/TatE family subunit [Thermoanaerobaculia bacterium]